MKSSAKSSASSDNYDFNHGYDIRSETRSLHPSIYSGFAMTEKELVIARSFPPVIARSEATKQSRVYRIMRKSIFLSAYCLVPTAYCFLCLELVPIYPASHYNSTNRIAGFIILILYIRKSRIPQSGRACINVSLR